MTAMLGFLPLLLGATALVGYGLGLSPAAGTAITLLVLVLIGLEASSLRRWTLARNGRPARAIATMPNHHRCSRYGLSATNRSVAPMASSFLVIQIVPCRQ